MENQLEIRTHRACNAFYVKGAKLCKNWPKCRFVDIILQFDWPNWLGEIECQKNS